MEDDIESQTRPSRSQFRRRQQEREDSRTNSNPAEPKDRPPIKAPEKLEKQENDNKITTNLDDDRRKNERDDVVGDKNSRSKKKTVELTAMSDSKPVDDRNDENPKNEDFFSPTDSPTHAFEPIRSDPVKALHSRQRRLDRISATMPEIHFLGQIISGRGLIRDSTEGSYCRWKIDTGNAWQHIGGDLTGQTHVSYMNGSMLSSSTSPLIFNHPIDVHFAEAGIQVSFSNYINNYFLTITCLGMGRAAIADSILEDRLARPADPRWLWFHESSSHARFP